MAVQLALKEAGIEFDQNGKGGGAPMKGQYND
jgi:hypothetical protein